MVRSEVLKLLNTPGASFPHVVNAFSNYVKSPNILPRLVNRIVLKAQKKQNLTSEDLFRFFYEELQGMVQGTKLCSNKYRTQMFLKNVWQFLQLQTLVINQIRKNYAIMNEPEDIEVVEEKPKKKIKKKETPEERAERLKIQAEKMRLAKAAKKAEKESKKEPNVKVEATPKVEPEIRKSEPRKELTPEQEQQLAMLKNLKI